MTSKSLYEFSKKKRREKKKFITVIELKIEKKTLHLNPAKKTILH